MNEDGAVYSQAEIAKLIGAREVCALEQGEASLTYPTTLSAADIEDLEAWIGLVIKKWKRIKGVGQ
ncbi:MAG TPA: hypothetical protein VGP77_10930 [Vicinamibacterales bacterium]|jgi:hypothetical protein|nr:hypothetical protein [Vicinamibacterales bacterium]